MNRISSHLSALLNNPKFSDVEFHVRCENASPQLFHAHRLVLAMASPVFAQKFYPDEAISKFKIDIDNVSPEIFFLFLNYVYTDVLEVSNIGEAYELNALATEYKMKDLEELSGKEISRFPITVESVFKLYDTAVTQNITFLSEQCRSFISQKTDTVLKSRHFLQASCVVVEDMVRQDALAIETELDLIVAVVKWGEERHREKDPLSNVRKFINPFIRHLRFLTLKPDELMFFLEKYDILTSFESFAITSKVFETNYKMPFPDGLSSNTDKRRFTATDEKSDDATAKTNDLRRQLSKPEFDNLPKMEQNSTKKHNPRELGMLFNHQPSSSNNIAIKEVYNFALKEMPRRLEAGFPTDIISTIELSTLQGQITLHGVKLHIKNKTTSQKEQITVIFRSYIDSSEHVYTAELENDVITLQFLEPLILTRYMKAKFELTVESLQLQRCCVCERGFFEVNHGLDAQFQIQVSSNRTNSEGIIYFLVSEMMYSTS